MPDFQADLLLEEIDQQSCGIVIQDRSNYDDSDQPGYTRLDFTGMRRIDIIRPNDDDIYRLETDPFEDDETDLVIADPETDPNPTWTVTGWNLINGSYSVRMVVAPDWRNGVTYTGVKLVTRNQVLYRLNAASSLGEDPITSPSWEEITFEEVVAQQATYSQFCVIRTDEQSCADEGNTILYRTSMAEANGTVNFSLSNCQTMTIRETSNYSTTDEKGHALEHFDAYYEIVFERPDGSEYRISPLTPSDETVNTPAQGNEQGFNYSLTDLDTDGLWIGLICSVPSYQADVPYTSMNANNTVIVYHNEKLWRQVNQNLLNSVPSDDNADWEEFTGDLTETRYCYKARLAVTCKTIDPCWIKIVEEYVCERKDGKCSGDLCGTTGRKYIDVRIAKDAIQIGMKNRNWDQVKDAFDLALNTCDC